MRDRHIIAAGIVLTLIMIGMFVFAYIKNVEIQDAEMNALQVQEDSKFHYGTITNINANHYYNGKSHVLFGEILMQTPCDLLNWEVRILESYPEQVIIDFSVVNYTDACTQIVTLQPFTVVFDASMSASVVAKFLRKPVALNLTTFSDEELPDSVKLILLNQNSNE